MSKLEQARDAISEVRKKRPGSIETAAQEEVVENFAANESGSEF